MTCGVCDHSQVFSETRRVCEGEYETPPYPVSPLRVFIDTYHRKGRGWARRCGTIIEWAYLAAMVAVLFRVRIVARVVAGDLGLRARLCVAPFLTTVVTFHFGRRRSLAVGVGGGVRFYKAFPSSRRCHANVQTGHTNMEAGHSNNETANSNVETGHSDVVAGQSSGPFQLMS